MTGKRKSYERKVIERFEKVVGKNKYQTFKSHGKSNRIKVKGNAFFQFGVYRVETEKYHLIIETESSGGVTNLVKYWYLLGEEFKEIAKPIILFHIYRLKSEDDWIAHRKLWKFLWEKMSDDLGEKRMKAKMFTYTELEELKDAEKEFEKYL